MGGTGPSSSPAAVAAAAACSFARRLAASRSALFRTLQDNSQQDTLWTLYLSEILKPEDYEHKETLAGDTLAGATAMKLPAEPQLSTQASQAAGLTFRQSTFIFIPAFL